MATKSKKIEVEDFGSSLAEEIKKISGSLGRTKLNEDALVILLAEASGVRRGDVRAILQALPRLSKKYLKQEELR